MKEKLHEMERASLSLLQLNLSKNIINSPVHARNIFSEKFYELRRKIMEMKEHTEGKRNITVLVGRSGIGKTHIVNKILNMSKPSDEEYQKLNENGNEKSESLDIYSIPDPENFFSEFTTNIFLRYSKLDMKHTTLRNFFMTNSEKLSQYHTSSFLLPEVELSTSAKVPFRIVYGSELRVTLVFDEAQTIQSLLDLLKRSVKYSQMEVETGEHFPESFSSDIKMHFPDKNNTRGLLKALSILGLNPNTNLSEIDFENLCIPKDLSNVLGTCVSFMPGNNSTFAQQLNQIKTFIFHNSCCYNKFSHVIRYIVIQYPSMLLNGLELIDTPGLTSESSFDSEKMHNDVISSASTVIEVCDERKIDDGFRTILLKYLLAENFHHKRKRFFIVNNLREPQSSKFEKNLVLLRLRELTSLEYLTTTYNAKLYDDFRKNCSVFIHSKYQNIPEFSLRKLIDILCINSSYSSQDYIEDFHRIHTLLIETVTDCRYLLQELLHFSWSHEHFSGELVDHMLLLNKITKSNICEYAFLSDEFLLSERVSEAYEKAPAFNSNTFLALDTCIDFGLIFGAKPSKIAHIFLKISECKENIVKYYFLAICMGCLKEYTQNSIMNTFESFLKIFLDSVLPFVSQQILSTHKTNLRYKLLQNYVFSLHRKIMQEISFPCSKICQEQFECALCKALKQVINDECVHNRGPVHLVNMNGNLYESIRSTVLKYCILNLQQNFSSIIDKCIFLCNDFTKSTIQDFDQELSQFVLDTLIINLEYLPRVKVFLSTMKVQFWDVETIMGRTYSEICCKPWTRNEYETFFIELPKLIDSNFEESAITQIFNHIWSARLTEVDEKNSLMSLRNKIVCACNLYGADFRVFSWISCVLNFNKIPRHPSPRRISSIVEISDFTHVFSPRRRAILNGISFIISKIDDDVFFNEWGSDVLVTLYFFMEISCDDVIVDICERNLNIGVKKWQILNSCLQFSAGGEDIKYLLEGIFILYKLSRKHAKLRRQIYAKINRLHSSTLLSINKQNKLNTLSKSKASELNDDMVWSFFFRENGVHIENGSEIDLDIRCRTNNTSLRFSKLENNIFREHSYFVTHKIFTKSEWCQYSLIPEEWLVEISFMKFNLPNFIRVRDVEITGEFVQALKGAGIPESDEDIQRATKFLINTQHFDGSWLQSEIDDRKYHATVCAVGALLGHNYKYRRNTLKSRVT